MELEGSYRTFVKLDPFDREVIRAVRLGLEVSGGKKVNQAATIQFIIRHYWDLIQQHGNPKLIQAIREKVTSSPEKPSLFDILECPMGDTEFQS
jgi:hypothetical protein